MGKVDQNDIQIKELNEHMEHRNLTEKMIAFQICDLVFKIKNQLKKHNKKDHEAGEGEKLCNYCDTKFNENCHYFKNQKSCPYEELGCMFQHEDSPMFRFQEKCLKDMCQYKHKDDNEQNDKDVKAETGMFNLYPQCRKKLTTKGDLNNHTKIHDKEEKSDNSMRTELCL